MRMILVGIGGKMGGHVLDAIEASNCDIQVVAGVDLVASNVRGIPCYPNLASVPEEADCILDFSNHLGTADITAGAVTRNLPMVIATTGQTEEEIAMIHEAAKSVPIFFSANMSLGVALLVKLAKIAAQTMPNANIEIVEKHHNRKLDAPSGTALMIANAIKEVRQHATFLLGRSGHGKRTPEEIGIHALRLGNIVGEHEVLITTEYETISLKHEAYTRALFAEGAITAIQYLVNQPAGLYAMQDMIG